MTPDPSTEASDPSAESTDPSIEGTDPSTGSTDPSTGSTGPGTGSTGPGTGSTGPGSHETEDLWMDDDRAEDAWAQEVWDGDDRHALVHLGARRWVLEPGQSVSFGRGSPCDIRLAHDPLDEHVSRRAGVVEHLGEELVVRNESTSGTLIFTPARGRTRVIRPGEAITCLPHREFLVALPGRGGNHYVLQVTAPSLGERAS